MSELTDLAQARQDYEAYTAAQSPQNQKLLRTALQLASQHYPPEAQTHIAHEPVLQHLLAAAKMVADMDLLPEAVAATVLAEISSYLPNWQEIVAEQCGKTVVTLVQGIDEVQKLTHFAKVDALATPEERAAQAETMRKMLLAMVSDIRVVLIKLALRTRTMQFLGQTPDSPEKRAVAKETLDIFAPLANRLGVWQLKWQLEDLGFRHQNPEEYKRIAKLLEDKRTERLEYIAHFLNIIRGEMDKVGIQYDVAGRPKHIYSIYKKMVKKKLDFDGLYDIRAVRILVNTIPECYATLGIIHSLFQPIPGEFDDYIANPKGNGYKSLHTVIVGPEAGRRTGATKKAARATARMSKKSHGCASFWIGAKTWQKAAKKTLPPRLKPNCLTTPFMCSPRMAKCCRCLRAPRRLTLPTPCTAAWATAAAARKWTGRLCRCPPRWKTGSAWKSSPPKKGILR